MTNVTDHYDKYLCDPQLNIRSIHHIFLENIALHTAVESKRQIFAVVVTYFVRIIWLWNTPEGIHVFRVA